MVILGIFLTSLPIKWAGKAANPLYHSFRQKDTGNDAPCQSLSLWEQRRRPPPVAETGRSCWGRGQQDASGSEADAGSRNPGSVTEGDGEGKPGRKEPLRSDGQALCQSDTIAVPMILGQQPCPLSLVALLLASSPRGGATGEPVSFRLDAESPTGRKRAGLATEVRLSFVQPLSLLRSQLP